MVFRRMRPIARRPSFLQAALIESLTRADRLAEQGEPGEAARSYKQPIYYS